MKTVAGLFLLITSLAPTLWSQQKIQKDERLAVILSLSVPGMGQIYAGRTWRGIGIMATEFVCMGTIAAITERRKTIKIQDVEGDNYEIRVKKNHKLNGAEIAGVAAAGVAGLGVYIWQLFDAKKCVKSHNRTQGFDVGLSAMPNGTPGLTFNMNF